MKGAYLRVCGSVAAVALLAVGCGEILGLDGYELADSAGAGGSGGAAPGCGNGVVDPGEGCDDGNDGDGDGCTSCVVDGCHTCANAEGGSICLPKTVGEVCTVGFCDGAGTCVECLVDAHCISSAGRCEQNKCITCTDTFKNGDETDIDCGGTQCAPCTQGKNCLATNDCLSAFCIDGVCCDSACDVVCAACNVPGFVGECAFVEKYGEDMSYGAGEACTAAEGEACTGGGFCSGAVGKTCAANADCASTRCTDSDNDGTKTCVKLTGESCVKHADCFSNNCLNGLCAM